MYILDFIICSDPRGWLGRSNDDIPRIGHITDNLWFHEINRPKEFELSAVVDSVVETDLCVPGNMSVVNFHWSKIRSHICNVLHHLHTNHLVCELAAKQYSKCKVDNRNDLREKISSRMMSVCLTSHMIGIIQLYWLRKLRGGDH